MEYLIMKNNMTYLKYDFSGKVTFTTNISLAEHFSYNQAENYLNCNISPKDKWRYNIAEIENSINVTKEDKDIGSQKSVQSTKDEILQYKPTLLDEKQIDWQKTCELLHNIYNELPQYKINIKLKYKDIEAELTDAYHYIELNDNMNACNGYKAYKMLKDILKRRRKIKDEMLIVDTFLDTSIQQHASGRMIGAFEGLKNRKYAPRVLNDLF